MLIKQTNTITVAGEQAFPLRGSQYEILQQDSVVEFAITTDVAVVNATVYSGSDLLLQSAAVDVLAAASPQLYPDHFILKDAAAAGERLGVELMKISGAASAVRTQVNLTPIIG